MSNEWSDKWDIAIFLSKIDFFQKYILIYVHIKKFIFKCKANYYFCMLKNGGGSKANMVCFAIKK